MTCRNVEIFILFNCLNILEDSIFFEIHLVCWLKILDNADLEVQKKNDTVLHLLLFSLQSNNGLING